jgi:MprA protease rhombosortase-interaction domain-containing protein
MTVLRRSLVAVAPLLLIAMSLTAARALTTPTASAQGACSILALDMGNAWDNESLDAIGGFTYTLVSPASFATADLSQYDVLYVGSAFQDGFITVPSQASLDALNGRTADIEAFVLNGGGIVALSEPIGTGRFTWVPLPGTPGTHNDVEEITVTAPFHPVNAGLNSAALSFWLQASHHSFTSADAAYVVLSRTTLASEAMTLAATYGDGRLVISGQDPDYHRIEPDGTSAVDPGTTVLLTNALNWACEPAPVGGEVTLPDLTGVPMSDATQAVAPFQLGNSITIALESATALLLAGAAGFALRRLRS